MSDTTIVFRSELAAMESEAAEMREAIASAVAILENDLYRTRVKNALAVLREALDEAA